MLTDNKLKNIYLYSKPLNRQRLLPYLNRYMEYYAIDKVERQASFLAQIGHESGQLFYTEEIASGRAYEGRLDLGNTFKGDGVRFKGRGLIQITGRHNYTKLSMAFGIDFIANPELLKTPEYAVQSACWWWAQKGLNEIADQPTEANFKKITRIINGGLNGYSDRHNLWTRANRILTL